MLQLSAQVSQQNKQGKSSLSLWVLACFTLFGCKSRFGSWLVPNRDKYHNVGVG